MATKDRTKTPTLNMSACPAEEPMAPSNLVIGSRTSLCPQTRGVSGKQLKRLNLICAGAVQAEHHMRTAPQCSESRNPPIGGDLRGPPGPGPTSFRAVQGKRHFSHALAVTRRLQTGQSALIDGRKTDQRTIRKRRVAPSSISGMTIGRSSMVFPSSSAVLAPLSRPSGFSTWIT